MAERGGPVSLNQALKDFQQDMGWGSCGGNISDADCNADPNG
jgi:hypothetical protein